MPVIAVNSPPYASAEEVLQLARTLVLDANVSISGDLLADDSQGVVISAATQAGFVVTVTTNQSHNLAIGNVVNVKNVTVPGYNGLQTVQSVPGLNQFTYTLAVNGLAPSSGGSVSMSPSQGFVLLTSAYRYVQARLANLGYEMPHVTAVLQNLTPMPAAVRDPAQQAWLGYDAYFDGQNNLTPAVNGTPVLPPDMLIPEQLMERIHGSGSQFRPMTQPNGPIYPRQQTAFNGEWFWSGDRIYLQGAVNTLDLWLFYTQALPALTQGTDMVRIFQGQNAVAYTLANRFSAPRGGDVSGHYVAERDDEIRQIAGRTARKTDRRSERRPPYGGGHAGGFNE